MNKNNSNSDKIAENSVPGVARMVKLEIVVEGSIIRHFKHFTLRQSARRHHSFELILAHDVLQNIQNHQLSEAQKFLGKRITVIFTYRDAENQSPERNFIGVITNVSFSQQKMSLGNIILKGYSPTILMDAAPHFQSFGGDKPVNTSIIADNVIRQCLDASKFDFRVDTRNKSYINYSAQYNETHYNYLARIAEAYGEQFYYDGEIMHFGNLPPHEKPITLTYGSTVSEVLVELNTVYSRPQYFGYSSSSHNTMKGIDSEIRHPGELPAKAYELNEKTFRANSFTPAPVNPNIGLDIDDSQKSRHGSAAVEVFKVSGKTTIPFLYPGCVADIEMRQNGTNSTSYFTRLMMTEVSHEVDALGNYTGTFEAIAEGTGFMPQPEFTIPSAQPQVAKVISNTDPLSQGRIQVRFNWQTIETTHFIRMMSPDAGGTDAVQQNRGVVSIPEVGDQVMVGFEYHHPDFPFAMGAMFHGKKALGGGTGNHLKSIQTRSGIKVLMDDAKRSVTIKDPSGNTYFMDGTGNITLTAPGNFTVNAGKDITLNAGKNLEVKTGNSMEFISGNLASFHMISGAVFSAPLMEFAVPVHLNIQSGKTTMLSEEETSIQGKNTNIAGMEKLMIHSDQETTVNSKGTTHVLGKDGNSLSNIPRDYLPFDKKMDGRCLVHFRPKPDWEGKGYGFDWVRAGDTTLPGDSDYSTIMKSVGYSNTIVPNSGKYLDLIASFSYYNYTHTDNRGIESQKSYAVPYLTLYPQTRATQVSATLDVLVNIQEPPTNIELDYDHSKFQIVHPPFPLGKGNHEIAITITCTRPFSTDELIKVISTYPGRLKSHKRIAGAIKVKANHTTYELPIVFINVTTDIGSGRRSSSGNKIVEMYKVKDLFRQAYINPDFKQHITLDLSEDAGTGSESKLNWKTTFNKMIEIIWKEQYHIGLVKVPGEHAIQENPNKFDAIYQLRDFLSQQLQLTYPQRNFSGVKKVFFINQLHQLIDNKTFLGGIAPGADSNHPEDDVVIMFRGYDSETIAHELMHCLGLYHTFEIESKFIFEKGHTDNVMDYPVAPIKRISTYNWQWEIMQRNARPIRN